MSSTQMHQVEQKDYERARPVLAELADIHLNITAILDGNCPGKVYVDDVDHPQTGYAVTSGDGHYVAGVPHNHAFNKALNALLPRDTYFALFCDPDSWGSALDVVLKDTYAIQAPRRYYTLDRINIVDWQTRIPAGFAMERITPGLLDKDLENTESVLEWILEEWGAQEQFFAHGFGFCLVHGAEIVSWSLSDYVSGDRCEIGIQTDADYRRRGFGSLAATATAAHAAAQGFASIGWHCWDNNAGSIGVAENVGFVRTADYDVFINHWVAENISDMTQDEFVSFAEGYEREFEANPPVSGFPHLVAAKARALGRDRGGCFRHLNKAVDLGWLRSVEQLREIWPEFFWNPNLDQMQAWQDLAERLKNVTK